MDTQLKPWKGEVTIHPIGRPEDVVFESPNVIVTASQYLVARLMTNPAIPLAGVWGLALGSGQPSWTDTNFPDPSPTQSSLYSEVLRKPLANVQYLDTNGNPTANVTNVALFSTIINATTDGLTGTRIQEMGLIGGGLAATYSAPGVINTPATVMTDIVNVPYFDPTVGNLNSVILINYRTTPPIYFPPGVSMAINWRVSF